MAGCLLLFMVPIGFGVGLLLSGGETGMGFLGALIFAVGSMWVADPAGG